MAVEIEIKAWAHDPIAIRARMEKTAVFRGSFEKEDAYWAAETDAKRNSSPLWLRIRKEKIVSPAEREIPERVLATCKLKEIRDGMEINEETEFSINGTEEFEKFLMFNGYRKQREKRKKGFSYTCGDINVELCEIAGLGWFAELEIIGLDREEKTLSAARGKLFACLEALGIEKDDVETRFYSEMLKNNAGPQ